MLWLRKIPWQHPHSHQTLKSLLHASNVAQQHMGLVCVLRLPTSVCACGTAPPEHVVLITPVGQPGWTLPQRMCLVVPALGKPTCCFTQAVSMQKSQTMPNIYIAPRQKLRDGKKTQQITMETCKKAGPTSLPRKMGNYKETSLAPAKPVPLPCARSRFCGSVMFSFT